MHRRRHTSGKGNLNGISGIVLAMLGLCVVLTFGALAQDVLTIDDHVFEFLGVTYNEDGTSTWIYHVTSGNSPALSHWVIELDPSFGEDNVVDASESFEITDDPRTGVYGLKFDDGYKDDEDRDVEFVLDAAYGTAETRVATKAGRDSAIGEVLLGPSSEEVEGGDNEPPEAVDDEASITSKKSTRISILDNDSDPDGDNLVIDSFTQPSHGTVKKSGRKKLEYTPDRGYNGIDTFTYTVSDENGGTATATVTITVGTIQQEPEANGDRATTDEGVPVTIDILANDIDHDGTLDPATVIVTRDPREGTLSVDPATGIVTYAPDEGECGGDSFRYTVEDDAGQRSNEAEVEIEVLCNEAPIAPDDEASTDENVAVDIDVTGNDFDPDGSIDPTTVSISRTPRDGSVHVNPATGAVTYTPDPGFCGRDDFRYTIDDNDGASSDEARVEIAVFCNAAPEAKDDAATTDENTSVGVDVVANDSDRDGTIDPATVTVTNEPRDGTLSVHSSTGVITYTPDPGSCGVDDFRYTIEDDDGATSNEASVEIEVLCNEPPLAIDDLYTTNEGQTLRIADPGVLSNDVDTPGSPLSAILRTGVEHGTLTLNPDGSFVYEHDGSETTSDEFTYVANDTKSDSNIATVSIVIKPTNDPPVAIDDEGTTKEDHPLELAVLDNDSDPDHDGLSVDWITQPTSGSVANHGGRVTYAPDPDFNGTDSFMYGISDGHGGMDSATVTVLVTPENDPPIAQDDSASTDEDAPVTVSVLANDSDPDHDGLDITSIMQAANGDVDNNGSSVTYTPDPGFNGSDNFTYTVSDGHGGKATATVLVIVNPVNDAPLAEDDTSATHEDESVTIAVLANDSDPDGDALTIQYVTQPTDGLVENNGLDVTYTPDPGFNGSDTFTYTVSDGNGGTDTAIVDLEIEPVNDAPLAQDDSASTDEDVAVTISVLANDNDPDGDALSVQSVTQPANGSVASNGSDVIYTPDPGFNGFDVFEYTIADSGGATDTATARVVVGAVNDPPSASDDQATTDEETSVIIDVLANDSDPDGDALEIESVNQPPHGSLVHDGERVTYVPDPGYNGTDSFTYTVSDGNGETATARVVIEVLPVNDAPNGQDDSDRTSENTPVTVAVLANDSDPDGDTLVVESVTQPMNGSTTTSGNDVTYTPNPGFEGNDSFTYTISDGNGGFDDASVEVTVVGVNDPPIAVDDSESTREDRPVTIRVLENDTDPDGDTLALESVSLPLHGAAVRSGTHIVYTPSPNHSGEDTFRYTVTDGKGSTATATVTVNVFAENDAPRAQDDSTSTQEDVAIEISVLGNDSDPDGDALRVESLTQPDDGVVANLGDGVRYVPDPGFSGVDTFTYTASDGHGGTAEASVIVTVIPTNNPPTAQNDSVRTDEGVLVAIPVLANDEDSDGDFLLVETFSEPAHGSVLNTRTGLSYIPDDGFEGVDTFSYTVSDGNGGTDRATVTVSVAGVNERPDAVDDNRITDEGVALTILVLENDDDPDGDPLLIESIEQPENGVVTHDGTSLTYTPDPGTSGVDVFTYVVADGNGGTDEATVFVAVAPVNDVPNAQDDSDTTEQDTILVISVLDNDTDPDGDPLSILRVTQSENGSVSHDGRQITYTPNEDFAGTDTFEYTVIDVNGLEDTANVTVGVSGAVGGGGARGGAVDETACEGKLIISEIAWAGTASDPRDEWIELRNLGTSPVDLDGWVLRWRRTHPSTPEEQVWKVVELHGILAPSDLSACEEALQDVEPGVEFKKDPTDEISWQVQGALRDVASGFYTLERRHDATVSDVKADLIYDTEQVLNLELSDLGEIVMLVNPYGEVVDTANASNLGRNGWVAGSAATFATMERIDALGDDIAANWNTNMGLVISGEDARSRPLRATAGESNSPAIERLQADADMAPVTVRSGESLQVDFTLPRPDRKTAGWPWISVWRPGFTGAAGTGGSDDIAGYSFSGGYQDGEQYALDIGTQELPPGSYSFWIIYGEGKAILLPILVAP